MLIKLPRQAESNMAQLIDWAKNAHDLTTNQGVKPSLVYVVNRENVADLKTWCQSSYATAKILDMLRKSDCFEIERIAWKKRGKTIHTAEELLLCYYDSIRVIFVPEFIPNNPICEASVMKEQYRLLYENISTLSEKSAKKREKAGILSDFISLSKISVAVLDLLTVNFKNPIDLRTLASLSSTQTFPTSFRSHVINTLSNLTMLRSGGSRREQDTVLEIAPYLASAVAGEILRATGMDVPHENQFVLIG